MKKMLRVSVLLGLVVLFVTQGFAQKERSKDELFKEVAALSNSSKPEDKEKAYQTGKEFLTRFGSDKNENVKKVRSFVEKYRTIAFYKAVDGNKFADAFAIGKEMLADNPGNVEVLLNLTYAGYNAIAAGEKAYTDDAIGFGKKAIELLDAGTTPNSWAPFKDKPEATAWMYFIEGTLTSGTDKRAGASNIYKATLVESTVKETSVPYYVIAQYYEEEYVKLGSELKVKGAAKPVNEAEVKALTEKIIVVLDVMLDAYARATKRADAENAANKTVIKDRLAVVYKFVKKTDVGLAEFIGYINKTAMPDPAKF